MKSKLNGAEIGPGKGWADWRKRRDKAITKPRKNAAGVKLAKRSQSAKESQ